MLLLSSWLFLFLSSIQHGIFFLLIPASYHIDHNVTMMVHTAAEFHWDRQPRLSEEGSLNLICILLSAFRFMLAQRYLCAATFLLGFLSEGVLMSGHTATAGRSCMFWKRILVYFMGSPETLPKCGSVLLRVVHSSIEYLGNKWKYPLKMSDE